MRELVRSNETVFLSWAEALLKSENIDIFILDEHMSALEGHVSAFPRRVLVADQDYGRARQALEDAGEGDRLV